MFLERSIEVPLDFDIGEVSWCSGSYGGRSGLLYLGFSWSRSVFPVGK